MEKPDGRPRQTGREAIADRLVRLGQLQFEDFCQLDPLTIRSIATDPDWSVALQNAPHVELSLCRVVSPSAAVSSPFSRSNAGGLDEIQAAQERLVRRYALELLREKAPPLFDCLPWHDWDFAVVARQVPVWQTRFLLTGAGATTTVCQLRRSAGVYVLEQLPAMREYVLRKAEMERVRRLAVVEGTVEKIPLAAAAADLAIVGGTGRVTPVALAELRRVARRLLVVDNDPWMTGELPPGEWEMVEVAVRGLGIRTGWWLERPTG
uniref:Uncharacterized protein n=1 Tax=candidate division WOR-3 bacterium TaxID=2052148 RepID=A0A7C4GJ24_UNCW3